MKKFVDVTWNSQMEFDISIDDHKIKIDTGKAFNGNNSGPTPKPLMLAALGGCTGMDVVSLLKKMRVEYSYFNIRVEGDLTEEHPKQFECMKLIYEFRGENMDKSKVVKAIEMSLNKYCGVNAVYSKVMDVTYELNILE